MALVIRAQHRPAFSSLLDQMYRLRRRVFVENLGWTLDTDGVREIDQFDNGNCVNLVALDSADQVRACVRFTASTEPNVTNDVLAAQMGASFPRGPHIAEISRQCVDPELDEAERKAVLLDLRISQEELVAKFGWTHFLGVSYDRHIQPFVRIGMKVEILGAPFLFPGDKEFSFGWMVSQNPARPQAIRDFLGTEAGRLQDPLTDPDLFIRYGDPLKRKA